jgi:hypothetical protein
MKNYIACLQCKDRAHCIDEQDGKPVYKTGCIVCLREGRLGAFMRLLPVA